MEQSPPHAEPDEKLKNSEVSLSIHRKPGCRVEFEVETSSPLVRAAQNHAIKLVAKEVSLPGFRKGRVPDALVLKNFPDQIDKKWQELIADSAFRESQKLAGVPLLHQDGKVTYKMKKHSIEGAELTLSFETEPSVPTVDPKQFHPSPVKRPDVNEEKASETIRQLQLFYANWKTISDRPAQEGDFVLLDIDVLEKGTLKRLFTNTRFEVTKKSMAAWMRPLVIGLSTGQSAEGVSTPDEEVPTEEKEAFQPKTVRLFLKAIEAAEVPAVDDRFAQMLGVANVSDLRTSLLNLLTRQAEDHVKEELRKQVNEFLLSQHPFELPATLIEKETRFRMNQLGQDPAFHSQWNEMKPEEKQQFIQSLYQQSEKAIRIFYLCRKILSDAQVSITANDLPSPSNSILETLLTPPSQGRKHGEEPSQAEAYSRIVLEKAEDFIIAHASSSA